MSLQVKSLNQFHPFGKEVLSLHPSQTEDSHSKEVNCILLSSKLNDRDVTEEVCWSGKTAVLSYYCSNSNENILQQCYTVDSPIKNVVWSSFYLTEDANATPLRCLCILDRESLHVFTTEGTSFVASLPFKVKGMWQIYNGICIEREAASQEAVEERKSMPTLFSLTHPLEDFKPVVYRYPDSQKTMYFSDTTQHIVYTSHDPAFIMTYDAVLGLHSIWKARKALDVDIPENASSNRDSLPEFFNFNPNHSVRDQSRMSLSPSLNKRHSCPPIPLTSKRSSPARVASPTIFSPSIDLIRKNTPQLNDHRNDASYNTSDYSAQRLSRFSSPMMFRMSCDESSLDDDLEPLPPDICMEQVWQEEGNMIRHGIKGKSTQCFITKDFCGRSYLIYIIEGLGKLKILQVLDGKEGDFIFQKPIEYSFVSAGDIPDVNVFVALDIKGEMTLFSGKHMIGNISVLQQMSPDHALLKVVSLKGFALCGFNTVYDDGSACRIQLHFLATNDIVLSCLSVIKDLMPLDEAASIYSKFYSILHSDQVGYYDSELNDEWGKFVRASLKLLGFPESATKALKDKLNSPAPPQAKRAKKGESLIGLEDWEYLAMMRHSQVFKPERSTQPKDEKYLVEIRLQKQAPLYKHIPQLFSRWHQIYEDLKMSVLESTHLYPIARFFHYLASVLNLNGYAKVYESDYLRLNYFNDTLYEVIQEKPTIPVNLINSDETACSIFRHVLSGFQILKGLSFHITESSCKRSLTIVKVFDVVIQAAMSEGAISDAMKVNAESAPDELMAGLSISCKRKNLKLSKTVVNLMAAEGFTSDDIDNLPFGYKMIIKEIIHFYRMNCDSDISVEVAMLLGREDIVKLKQDDKTHCTNANGKFSDSKISTDDDGMELDTELFDFRFKDDLRINEVKNLLNSSKQTLISMVQKPDVSDTAFAKEEEARLALICKRTMALPIGRGMFTLGTSQPIASKTVDIPNLDLSGKSAMTTKNIQIFQTEGANGKPMWPQFHNGVAAGLKIASGASQVDSTWILFNRLKSSDMNASHSGFLFALGLTGHLEAMPKLHLHDYLIKGHALTSAALLLGMATTQIGTKQPDMYKLLSLHLDSLLPPTALELSIPQTAQVAALVSVGLLYFNCADIHLVKVLLYEIGKPAGPEIENSLDRESHALAAGLALGMILIGQGKKVTSVADVNVGDMLYHYINGGQKKPMPPSFQEKFKTPSYAVQDGDCVNVSVTLPAACMALGLIYLKSGNKTIASWLSPSLTCSIVDAVKPDHVLIRSLAHSLVMWDSIVPKQNWLDELSSIECQHLINDLDQEMNYDQKLLISYIVCMTAGKCLALGLKFAGSGNKEAFELVFPLVKKIKTMLQHPVIEETGSKTIISMCLDNVLVSVSLIMAGTGNLQVFRAARQLHKRVTNEVTYGSHMAVHMAIGFLFLGGGQYTLKTDNLSIAALLCALYPKWPATCKDNQFHLQSLRHLYVLACEKRMVITRDISTNKICYAPIQITLKETDFYCERSYKLLSPCFIPELSYVKKLHVLGPRYWPILINLENITDKRVIIDRIGNIAVKKKAGYLTYSDDPKGQQNLLARTFNSQSDKVTLIKSFSSDTNVLSFAELFCQTDSNGLQDKCDFYSNILLDCVRGENLDVLHVYCEMEKTLTNLQARSISTMFSIQQLMLLFVFYDALHPVLRQRQLIGQKSILDPQYLLQARFRLEEALDSLKGSNINDNNLLIAISKQYTEIMKDSN